MRSRQVVIEDLPRLFVTRLCREIKDGGVVEGTWPLTRIKYKIFISRDHPEDSYIRVGKKRRWRLIKTMNGGWLKNGGRPSFYWKVVDEEGNGSKSLIVLPGDVVTIKESGLKNRSRILDKSGRAANRRAKAWEGVTGLRPEVDWCRRHPFALPGVREKRKHIKMRTVAKHTRRLMKDFPEEAPIFPVDRFRELGDRCLPGPAGERFNKFPYELTEPRGRQARV